MADGFPAVNRVPARARAAFPDCACSFPHVCRSAVMSEARLDTLARLRERDSIAGAVTADRPECFGAAPSPK